MAAGGAPAAVTAGEVLVDGTTAAATATGRVRVSVVSAPFAAACDRMRVPRQELRRPVSRLFSCSRSCRRVSLSFSLPLPPLPSFLFARCARIQRALANGTVPCPSLRQALPIPDCSRPSGRFTNHSVVVPPPRFQGLGGPSKRGQYWPVINETGPTSVNGTNGSASSLNVSTRWTGGCPPETQATSSAFRLS